MCRQGVRRDTQKKQKGCAAKRHNERKRQCTARRPRSSRHWAASEGPAQTPEACTSLTACHSITEHPAAGTGAPPAPVTTVRSPSPSHRAAPLSRARVSRAPRARGSASRAGDSATAPSVHPPPPSARRQPPARRRAVPPVRSGPRRPRRCPLVCRRRSPSRLLLLFQPHPLA